MVYISHRCSLYTAIVLLDLLRFLQETGSRTVPERDQNYEVTNLKKGRRYEFWITASTAAGEGSPSRVISQTPNGPTGLKHSLLYTYVKSRNLKSCLVSYFACWFFFFFGF